MLVPVGIGDPYPHIAIGNRLGATRSTNAQRPGSAELPRVLSVATDERKATMRAAC